MAGVEKKLLEMNGKLHDNPLSDLTIHGEHPFPPEIEELLLKIDALGRGPNRWPLGANWPFDLNEYKWAEGKDLDEARELLSHFIEMLEDGRGDEIMVNPITQRPFEEPK